MTSISATGHSSYFRCKILCMAVFNGVLHLLLSRGKCKMCGMAVFEHHTSFRRHCCRIVISLISAGGVLVFLTMCARTMVSLK